MIDIGLLFAVIMGIALLLFLILYLKIQAFLSLLISSLAVGLLAGMPPGEIIENMRKGMADTLGFVATVVGLGTLFGAILELSGGARAIANRLLATTGIKRAPSAMVVSGFIIAIPVFFDVGFIILVPLVYALQKKTGKSLLLFGLPLLAGLAITHAFIPPTPGPVAVADIIGAELGWVILFGFLTGIPTAIVSGPLFSRYISRKIHVEVPDYMEEDHQEVSPEQLPSAGMVASIIAIPILLIVANTFFTSPLAEPLNLSEAATEWIELVGHPFTALILANLIAWYQLGIRRGFDRKTLLKKNADSLAPAGIIILLTGAGGVFKQILIETGAGEMLAESITGMGATPLIFAFIVAALIRVTQGSATVAMITAAGMTAPLLEGTDIGEMQTALIVIAIASGATILSHVNDSGFWLVNRYFGLSEQDTLRSWSVMTTLIALTGFTVALLLSLLV